MTVYTVHAPIARGDAVPRAPEKFVFVRDGFHVWAMLFGPLWLIAHGLWWATLGYLVLAAALDVALVALGIGSGAIAAVMGLVALLMGFEASTLQRWTLSRGHWRQVGMVAAADAEMAERRFFARWAGRSDLETDPRSVDRGAPPPARPAGPREAAPGQPVLGLFPDPGLSR